MSPWAPDQPFDALRPPPGAEHLETRDVLKDAIKSRAALAQLDEAARSMPNPTVLINSLPLLEAQASSEIENIVTTTDALFRYADDDAPDSATRETLRYRTALRLGLDLVDQRGLTTATAEQVCTTIKGHEMRPRALPGTRIANPETGEIIYSPPEGASLIAQMLSEWERFVHAPDDMDPLVRMAAAHYYFEAIHPFTDGNGRTGRILNVLVLVEAGLIQLPILYLSRYIIDNKSDYYRLLLGITARGAWEPWLRYILRGVEVTARATVSKIAAIRDLQADFFRRARDVSKGATNADFQAVLFEQPYCRISTVVDRCDVSRPTATSWLSGLVGAGMLQSRKVGRDRLFVNAEFLDVLTRREPDES